MKTYRIFVLMCIAALMLAASFGCGGGKSVALFPVLKDGKWGYVNDQGKLVIPPQFFKAQDFADGLALVVVEKEGGEMKYGFIDETGRFVIEPKFSALGIVYSQTMLGAVKFADGIWWHRQDPPEAKTVFLDKTGKTVFELDAGKEPDGLFSDGLILVRSKKKDLNTLDDNFYYDTTGTVAFQTDFLFAEPFSDGMARVRDGGGYDGYIDKTGKTVIPPKFRKASDFSEGLAAVSEDGRKFGFIDKKGDPVGEPKFDEAGNFSDGLAVVRQDLIWGYVDKNGKWAFTPRFTGLAPHDFSEGLAVVLEKDGYQIIDKSGEKVAALDRALSQEKNIGTVVGNFQNGLARIIHSFGDGESRIVYFNRKGETVWNEKGHVDWSKKQ